ncbi:MAG: hypothetical protein C4567_09200 [Deltaproteobacteria bacterium]|nr:MAG: hypothetical protein C4567_09200 [Deltaproteobacteria bacterium]
MERRQRALFSLYDTEGVEEFARALAALGWEIIASRETSALLAAAGIPVTELEDFVDLRVDYGFPPSMHPKIEAALTLEVHPRLDLVYIRPYPLTVGNDVGGRTLLAWAAKGRRLPVMSPGDLEDIVRELRGNGLVSEETRGRLIDKTNAAIARHYLSLLREDAAYDGMIGTREYDLLEGENPYQRPAALFSEEDGDPLGLPRFRRISGEPPCFTNMADTDALIQSFCLAMEAFRGQYGRAPYICLAGKHGNACGMGVSWDDPAGALEKALFGHPGAVWGGELITNVALDAALAEVLYRSPRREKLVGDAAWMLDVVIAPEFSPEAVAILGKRQRRKLLQNQALAAPVLPQSRWSYRFVRGGFLRQPWNNYVLDLKAAEYQGPPQDQEALDSLIIAWTVAVSSSHGGNEIALAKGRMLLGAGGGPATGEATTVAVNRARSLGHELTGGAFAANAFFPFTDAPETLAAAGLRLGAVPAGGGAEPKVRAFFAQREMGMYYLPEEYRGFCRH